MASIINLNSSHIVAGSNNNQLRYKLTNNPFAKGNYEIALSKFEMYNSIFNINAQLYNNNVFWYYWLNNSGALDMTTKYQVTIPDGLYTTDQISQFFMSVMTANKHYLVLAVDTTQLTFFLTMSTNLSRYRCQLNAFKFFTQDQVNSGAVTNKTYNYPSGANWKLPPTGSSVVPSFYIDNNNFGDIIGFNQNSTVPPIVTPATENTSTLGTTAPDQVPVKSLILSANLVNNTLSYPTNVLASVSLSSDFGALNSYEPNQLIFMPIVQGNYNTIDIKICDQDFRDTYIQDADIQISLVIKEKVIQDLPK